MTTQQNEQHRYAVGLSRAEIDNAIAYLDDLLSVHDADAMEPLVEALKAAQPLTTIIVEVRGGLVEDVTLPKGSGIVAEVRDYDAHEFGSDGEFEEDETGGLFAASLYDAPLADPPPSTPGIGSGDALSGGCLCEFEGEHRERPDDLDSCGDCAGMGLETQADVLVSVTYGDGKGEYLLCLGCAEELIRDNGTAHTDVIAHYAA